MVGEQGEKISENEEMEAMQAPENTETQNREQARKNQGEIARKFMIKNGKFPEWKGEFYEGW